MIVIAAGEFMMGLRARGQHKVTIAKPFAVSKFDVTFADWDACVSVGGCSQVRDFGWGRGTKPVIDVNWYDAQQYVAWLSRMTERPYRLVTEAEWEYAARAGSTTAYSWGREIGEGNANCNGCGSKWDNHETSPVGSFKPNGFGLYDMAGNVAQWVQDCIAPNADYYDGVPSDGSAWTSRDCIRRVVRGGSFRASPESLFSASRGANPTDGRGNALGFRVGRALSIEPGTVASGEHH
jgi:formylglycine-generating enzyme required for sulfatase activity